MKICLHNVLGRCVPGPTIPPSYIFRPKARVAYIRGNASGWKRAKAEDRGDWRGCHGLCDGVTLRRREARPSRYQFPSGTPNSVTILFQCLGLHCLCKKPVIVVSIASVRTVPVELAVLPSFISPRPVFQPELMPGGDRAVPKWSTNSVSVDC